MSTYNGERYISEQLDSILSQTLNTFQILVRDDGSQDNTLAILADYADRYDQIACYTGANLGVQKSFFDLIIHADPQADYIAFSDQDDIWQPQKLARAVQCLQSVTASDDRPLLYCGAQELVDEGLNPIKATVSREIHLPSFGNALVQNICTGCTAVINRPMARMIREHRPDHMENIVMHDWWLYLTASCFGDVYYDASPYVKYRQHTDNVHGAIFNRRELLKYRLNQLQKPRGEIYRQIDEFYACYADAWQSDLYASNLHLLRKVQRSKIGLIDRIRLISDKRVYRQKWEDDLVYRGIVLLGKL